MTADRRLAEAAQAGDDEAVRQALSDGADPNASAGPSGGSVLDSAARVGAMGVVERLLAAGARAGGGPLRTALFAANPDVVRLLVAHGALTADATSRFSALLEAISYTSFRPSPGAVDVVRVLLDAGARPFPHEEAPLVAAVTRSAPPVVLRLLLAHGADPDQRRSDGVPALVVAARRGDHAAVDVLLAAGADPDARDGLGRTALMHAVERDRQPVAATLLVAGATVDAASPDGTTALALARGWQHQNIQFRLGEMRVGLDNEAITRTTVRLRPTTVLVEGGPRLFQVLADAIDRALDDLDDDEWSARTGRPVEVARAFAARLRTEPVPAAGASWHELPATAVEVAAARSALVELAYGTTQVMPSGMSRPEITDLLVDLDRQL